MKNEINYIWKDNKKLTIGSPLNGTKTLIMGIHNVTPDSVSHGGKWYNRDNALRHM